VSDDLYIINKDIFRTLSTGYLHFFLFLGGLSTSWGPKKPENPRFHGFRRRTEPPIEVDHKRGIGLS